jgi:DNA-binding Lrp family transcriptional regulator
MSGAYDLSVMIDGATMKEVALFVAQKLAPMESVISTATHFVLKKYKAEGFIFKDDGKDSRQVITL